MTLKTLTNLPFLNLCDHEGTRDSHVLVLFALSCRERSFSVPSWSQLDLVHFQSIYILHGYEVTFIHGSYRNQTMPVFYKRFNTIIHTKWAETLILIWTQSSKPLKIPQTKTPKILSLLSDSEKQQFLTFKKLLGIIYILNFFLARGPNYQNGYQFMFCPLTNQSQLSINHRQSRHFEEYTLLSRFIVNS